jgi:hypothetical protein
VFALASLGLLVALVEEPTWLNITYALLCLGRLALIKLRRLAAGLLAWVQRLGKWLFTGWDAGLFSTTDGDGVADAAWDVAALRRAESPRGSCRCLSSVFVILFGVANPIIAEWLSSFGNWLGG